MLKIHPTIALNFFPKDHVVQIDRNRIMLRESHHRSALVLYLKIRQNCQRYVVVFDVVHKDLYCGCRGSDLRNVLPHEICASLEVSDEDVSVSFQLQRGGVNILHDWWDVCSLLPGARNELTCGELDACASPLLVFGSELLADQKQVGAKTSFKAQVATQARGDGHVRTLSTSLNTFVDAIS